MAKIKAPVFKSEGYQTFVKAIARIAEICDEIDGDLPVDVSARLRRSIDDLRDACKAVSAIQRNGRTVGWGVSEITKSVACAELMELVKQIKKAKAW